MNPTQWKSKYAWLVWSNRTADDSAHLRAALLNPHLDILLDAFEAYGLARLATEWAAVRETERGKKVAEYVGSMLENFRRGVEMAAADRRAAPLLILDLEMTCAADGSIPADQMEVIEIGAVLVSTAGEVVARFESFVRPVERPVLTEFCRDFLHIEQQQIDAARPWPEVALEFSAWAARSGAREWGSWGDSDRRQIEQECARHHSPHPLGWLAHRNLKREFAKARKIKQVGIAAALRIAGIERAGAAHRALADAENVARIVEASAGGRPI